jgi:drug/metabolite transporter (DMT)-like permease
MPQTPRAKLMFAFLLVYFFWGSTYLAIGVGVRYFPPEVMGSIRFSTAALIMMLWCWRSGRRIRVSAEELIRLAIVGVLLLTIANLILVYAERIIPTGLAALIMSVTPLWFLVVETLVLRRTQLTFRGAIGLPLGLAGIVVLLWPKLSSASTVGWGELMVCLSLLLGALSFATGSVLAKGWKMALDPFSAAAWEMLFGGLGNLSVAVVLRSFPRTHWAWEGISAVGYLVLFGSLIGFSSYIYLLEHVSTAKVATYAYVNPVVAVFLGWLVLRERVDAYVVVGTAIVASSVALTTTAKMKRRTKAGEVEQALDMPAVESTG